MKSVIKQLSIVILWGSVVFSQTHLVTPEFFRLNSVSTEQNNLPSNSVSQMAVQESILWIGTSKGLAKTATSGKNWTTYGNRSEFANKGIYAVTIFRDTIWTSTGYNQKKDNNNIPTGSGYTYSTNGGLSWTHAKQTLDNRGDSIIQYGINSLRILPVVVPEQNVTYEISLSPGKTWIASWASGLRYTSDKGITWKRIILPPDNLSSIKPTDTLNFYYDPRKNNNFLAFSVLAIDDDTIWCGTAGGVNKSTDKGNSWKKFTRQNQNSPILSNWIITIKEQSFQNRKRIWTTNWKAETTQEEFGVSYTDDGGQTWKNLLHGIKAYDFAFKDSIIYIATIQGLYRTNDDGKSFSKTNLITDPDLRQIITSNAVFSVSVIKDTVFLGTSDGIAKTIDNSNHIFGSKWEILRRSESVNNTKNTYAYPNPFAPDDEYTRIHYSTGGIDAEVTIEVFDFGMNRVKTVIQNAKRGGNNEHDELWNGRDDIGRYVSNGVYFYRIILNNDEPIWGKIMVLR